MARTFIQVISLNCGRCKREAEVTGMNFEEVAAVKKSLRIDVRREIAIGKIKK